MLSPGQEGTAGMSERRGALVKLTGPWPSLHNVQNPLQFGYQIGFFRKRERRAQAATDPKFKSVRGTLAKLIGRKPR